ncbi:hypothetical protein RJ639_019805 [Escallonia herrerae]|uniref:Uncharacterized protein n=1 Tax=Escallonia herrerae TaxID=1293975 RepID=A0AA88V9D9_9ASTE|nr:hypothetical protein RJ639_019805 [Escallonia herrerae]
MEYSAESTPGPLAVKKLKPVEATPETFEEFGQVIEGSLDGHEFGPRDAQLDLSRGGQVWYLGVAKSSIVNSNKSRDGKGANVVQSPCGHLYVPPAVEDVRVFRIAGPKFLKLNRGSQVMARSFPRCSSPCHYRFIMQGWKSEVKHYNKVEVYHEMILFFQVQQHFI